MFEFLITSVTQHHGISYFHGRLPYLVLAHGLVDGLIHDLSMQVFQ